MIWRDRIAVTVEAGLRGVAVGDMTWDISNWDEAEWSGLEPEFVALDGWSLESVDTRRGREAWPARHPTGTAQIGLVWDSPLGNWSFRPSTPVALGMEMRISARVFAEDGSPAGDVIPIFRGTVREILDGWLPAKGGAMVFRITVRLNDRFADLAAVNLPEAAPTGSGDDSLERLARILALAGISDYYLRTTGADVTHSSSNFARNLLDEAQVTAESENGDLWIDREGFIYLRPSYGGAYAPTRETVSQLEWSNVGRTVWLDEDPDRTALGPTAFGTSQDLDDVVNQVSMARAGGTAYTVSDADSIARFGLRTNQRFDLTCQTDADVEAVADYRLEQLKDRTQRVDGVSVTLDAREDPDLLMRMIDIELNDRHSVRWTDGGATLAGAFLVQGVSHRISGDRWDITANLWARAGEGLGVEAARWSSGDLWSSGAVWG